MKRRMYLSSNEKMEIRRIIRSEAGCTIKGSIVLNQVFRRSSLAAETGERSNEIFEFIGDEVLSFYVTKIVSMRCGAISIMDDYTFRIRENKFTQIKQELVSNDSLAKIIDRWDIAKYLLLGKSDIKNEVQKGTKVKADLLEAIIGAIAVETNWDNEILETAVSKILKIDERIQEIIESESKIMDVDIDNAVTVLKELAERGQCTMPKYDFAGPDTIGYDKDGNPRWHCDCTIINDITGLSKGVYASSKKDAKKAAAYLILCEHLQMQNKYGKNGFYLLWIYKDGKLFPY